MKNSEKVCAEDCQVDVVETAAEVGDEQKEQRVACAQIDFLRLLARGAAAALARPAKGGP